VYDVYTWTLTNIDARCVVIIHGHWLALIHENSWNELIPSEYTIYGVV